MKEFPYIWHMTGEDPPEWSLVAREDEEGRNDIDLDMFMELSDEEKMVLLEVGGDLTEYAQSVGYQRRAVISYSALCGWEMDNSFEAPMVAIAGEDWEHDRDLFDMVTNFADAASNVAQYCGVVDQSENGGVWLCVLTREGVDKDNAAKAWGQYLKQHWVAYEGGDRSYCI